MNLFRQFMIMGVSALCMGISSSCSVVHRLFSSDKAATASSVIPSAPLPNTHSSAGSSSAGQMDVMQAYQILQQHLLQFHTYAARLKVNFMRDDEQQNVVVNLRIQSDSLIWMNATALLGIEVARALITPDSIIVINRLKRTYYQKSFSDIAQWLGVPVDFHMLQNLLVGNPPFLSPNIIDAHIDSTSLQLTMQADSLINQISVTLPAYHWQQCKLMIPLKALFAEDSSQLQSVIEYVYADSTQALPNGWQLMAGDAQHTTVQVDIQNAVLNQTLSFPFAIPAHYTPQR